MKKTFIVVLLLVCAWTEASLLSLTPLRKVNSSFSPTDLSGLILWLDASDSGTITKDGSNNVSQWNDKSGSSNNATSSGGARPVYSATGLNSKPALTQSGGATGPQYMLLTSGINMASISAFSVEAAADVSTFAQYVMLGGNTDDYGLSILFPTGFSLFSDGIASYRQWDFISVPSANTGFIHAATSTAAQSTEHDFINGVQLTSVHDSGGSTWNGSSVFNRIGARSAGSGAWNGAYSEIIIYNRTLSGTELTQVHSYLMSKWGI
jgi:hypothetical protein